MKLVRLGEARGEGFFLNIKSGKEYEVYEHNDFVIRNPEIFGLTPEKVASFGFDNDGRNARLMAVLQKGWIRIRRQRGYVAFEHMERDRSEVFAALLDFFKKKKGFIWPNDWIWVSFVGKGADFEGKAEDFIRAFTPQKSGVPYNAQIEPRDDWGHETEITDLIRKRLFQKAGIPWESLTWDQKLTLIAETAQECRVEIRGAELSEETEGLQESSLSRIWRHNEQHDCAALTAFRRALDCGLGKVLTTKEKLDRNAKLLAMILSKGYGATSLIGEYKEGDVPVRERAFWVVDLHDKGKLLEDVKEWGERFEQDSVLFVPKGAVLKEAKAFLIGTNHCANNWLGYGKTAPFDTAKFGHRSPIYVSYINDRPFVFERVLGEHVLPGNGMGVWAMNLYAQRGDDARD